jgi:hypothetical protein
LKQFCQRYLSYTSEFIMSLYRYILPHHIRRCLSLPTCTGSIPFSHVVAVPQLPCFRRFSSNANEQKPAAAHSSDPNAAAKQYMALKEANEQMKKYYDTRELMRQGKLKSLNGGDKTNHGATAAQAGLLVAFLVAFMATPFLGKRIAQDDEFRLKYVPSWYDFTVKKPENAWTREELHEQMLQVQHDVHRRAIAGEFTPEKLRELQEAMQSPLGSSVGMESAYPRRQGTDESRIPKEWDMVHPGMAMDEKWDEGED